MSGFSSDGLAHRGVICVRSRRSGIPDREHTAPFADRSSSHRMDSKFAARITTRNLHRSTEIRRILFRASLSRTIVSICGPRSGRTEKFFDSRPPLASSSARLDKQCFFVVNSVLLARDELIRNRSFPLSTDIDIYQERRKPGNSGKLRENHRGTCLLAWYETCSRIEEFYHALRFGSEFSISRDRKLYDYVNTAQPGYIRVGANFPLTFH